LGISAARAVVHIIATSGCKDPARVVLTNAVKESRRANLWVPPWSPLAVLVINHTMVLLAQQTILILNGGPGGGCPYPYLHE